MADTNSPAYHIPDDVRQQYPRLVELIVATESMNYDEKEYWFSILPIMTDDQVSKLQNILETERQKLEALNQKYQQQTTSLNDKHLIEWQAFNRKEQAAKHQRREAVEEQKESAEEAALLQEIQNL